ncbi:MAG TPA: pyridoxal phosphate-dependent aminotransferase [Anaerolineae bacterium]|nr:pyridoxal phosphate-dependent aminotransferase [Anaerolineae bacterium]HQJ50968.1 pyridoxal phosphate-dependent aminotransferase [Anaerolineae bacterium]
MPSHRSENIPPFLVMDVLEKAKELERAGQKVIHLEVGEPDFDTPAGITRAAGEALAKGETHYTHSLGMLPLREAIAAHYNRRYGLAVSPEQVIVTMGTSAGLVLTLSALLNPGDEMVLSNPTYACYPNMVQYVGGVPVWASTEAGDGFALHPEAVRERLSQRTQGILVNSPANPTGTVLSAAQLKEIAGLGPYVVSDEIYHGLVYGEREHSILEYTDRAFVLNGFSKLYAMTGWRLGYVIAPREFVRPLQKLQQNLFICASSISQFGGLAALTQHHPEVEHMVAAYDQRRRLMIKGLRELGFGVPVEPTGAFYVLADARWLGRKSLELAFDILEKVQVAVAPGIDFGSNAEGFLRFSYANSMENIGAAFERLRMYLASYCKS